jgi:hypothetical protein
MPTSITPQQGKFITSTHLHSIQKSEKLKNEIKKILVKNFTKERK